MIIHTPPKSHYKMKRRQKRSFVKHPSWRHEKKKGKGNIQPPGKFVKDLEIESVVVGVVDRTIKGETNSSPLRSRTARRHIRRLP